MDILVKFLGSIKFGEIFVKLSDYQLPGCFVPGNESVNTKYSSVSVFFKGKKDNRRKNTLCKESNFKVKDISPCLKYYDIEVHSNYISLISNQIEMTDHLEALAVGPQVNKLGK